MGRIIGAVRRDAGWRHVQTHGDALEFGAWGRIELHNQRIVIRDDVALVMREVEQPVEVLQHLAHMEGARERPAASHFLVEMTDVGGERDKSLAGLDPDELKSRRMASHRMHRQARCEYCVAIVEHHAKHSSAARSRRYPRPRTNGTGADNACSARWHRSIHAPADEIALGKRS